MKCVNCGNEIEDGNAFCSNCGTKVEVTVSTEPVAESNPEPEATAPMATPTTEPEVTAPMATLTTEPEVTAPMATPPTEPEAKTPKATPPTTEPEVKVSTVTSTSSEIPTPTETTPTSAPAPGATAQSTQGAVDKEPAKKGKKKVITGIIIAVVVLIIIAFLVIALVIGGIIFYVNKGKTISIEDDIFTYEVVGCDGYGTIKYEIKDDIIYDEERMEKLFPKTDEYAAQAQMSYILSTFDVEIENNGQLSSKDNVEVKVTYDEVLFEACNIKVKDDTFKIKIDELPEGQVLDVFKDVAIEYSGYSEYGQAVISLDDVSDVIKDEIRFSLDQSQDLSNGDSITITATYDERSLLEKQYVVSETERVYTVSELEELQEVDPFENLQVLFSGASPFLQVEFNTSNCSREVISYVTFSCADSNLRNGDTITVEATMADYNTRQEGIILSQTSKTYTVEGQREYMFSVNDADLTPLLIEIQDIFDARAAGCIGTGIFMGKDQYSALGYFKFKKMTCNGRAGEYFMVLKDGKESPSGIYNQLIYIYEYETVSTRGNEKATIYGVVYVNNIIIEKDGTISWDKNIAETSTTNYDDLVDTTIYAYKDLYQISDVKLTEESGTTVDGETNTDGSEADGTGTDAVEPDGSDADENSEDTSEEE